MARRQAAIAFLPAAAVFALLRLPSFVEPRWYTDEAGYLTTAQALLRQKVLYSGIWTNKPPLHPWTVAAVVWLFGTHEWALHLLTLVSGLAALAAVAYATARLVSVRRALFATLAMAVLLGLPILDSELAIPESVLIAPITWAGAVLAVKLHQRPSGSLLWPLGVGLLAATAFCYQQTALAESAAFGLVMLVSPQVSTRQFAAYVAGFAVPTATWVAAAIAVAGLHNVAFALVGFYVPYTQSAVPNRGLDTAIYAGGLAAAALLVMLAAVLLARRPGAWFFWVWAAASLAVPASTHLPYPHFLTPCVAPVVLGLATLAPRRWRAFGASRAQLGTASLAAAVLIVAEFASHAGIDFWPPAAGAPWINGYRTLGMYYGGSAQVAAGRITMEDWRDRFDDRVPADEEATEWLRQHKYNGATVVVWSSDAWPYVIGDYDVQLPTAPIYNDFVVLGGDGQVTERIQALNPAVIITSESELSEFGEIEPLLKSRYRRAYTAPPNIVWLRDDVYDAMVAAGS